MVKASHDAIRRGHTDFAKMKYNHPVRDVHGNKKG